MDKYKIEQEITNHIKDSIRDNGRNQLDEFRVSELVLCPARAYYYRTTELKNEPNGKMFSGIMFHEKIKPIVKGIELFKKARFEVECQDNFDGYTILGHADAVTKDCVYEFKFSASDMKRYPISPHWINQGNAYATLLKKKEFGIISVNSLTLDTTIQMYQKNKEHYKNTVSASAKLIFDCLKTNTVPLGPAHKWECDYCNLTEICENFKNKDKGEEDEPK